MALALRHSPKYLRSSINSLARSDLVASHFPSVTTTAHTTPQWSASSRFVTSTGGDPPPAGPAPSLIVPAINFSDSQAAYKSLSTSEIARALAIFNLCSVKPLVANSDKLVRLARSTVGDNVLAALMRPTFFSQFCAGEDGESIKPTIRRLASAGVGGILDYAAESDTDPNAIATPSAKGGAEYGVSTRYAAGIDAACDKHVRIFTQCIASARASSADAAATVAAEDLLPSPVGASSGFAAIKLTALADPILLQRGTDFIRAFRATFPTPPFPAVRADDGFAPAGLDCDGVPRGPAPTVSELTAFLANAFPSCPAEERAAIAARLDVNGDGRVDAREWAMGFTLPQMLALSAHAAAHTPLAAVLTPPSVAAMAAAAAGTGAPAEAGWDGEDVLRVQRVSERLEELARVARAHDVGLLIDAEQTYFQPLIDALVTDLQRVHNREAAVVWSTVQCYLVDAVPRATADLEAARREGWIWASKLVRGAYMDAERARAASRGEPSPIWRNMEETHASYARATKLVLTALEESVKGGYSAGNAAGEPRVALMIASHNQKTIEQVSTHLNSLAAAAIAAGLSPAVAAAVKKNVCFGQLLGMADHLTLTLARNRLRSFKYVPYGPIMEVMPYLVRRAKENSNMLGGVGVERRMLWTELKRRMLAKIGLGKDVSVTMPELRDINSLATA